jgi:hypothetical protein
MKYRIKFDGVFYVVQERMMIGWWVFKTPFWTTIDTFWSKSGAERMYKTLTKL